MQPENMAIQPNNNTNTKKNQMSKKQIIGLVALSLVAVGGVLFGIYGMNSQNEQIAELTERMQNSEKSEIPTADDMGNEYGDVDELTVAFSQFGFNTMASTMTPEEDIAQAIEISAEDLLTNGNVTIQIDDNDFVTMNFSVIEGKLKVSNENGNEYTIKKMDNLKGILNLDERYITVIDNKDNIYASPISRPIVWRAEKINTYCPAQPFVNELEKFEETFQQKAVGAKKIPKYTTNNPFDSSQFTNYYIYGGYDGTGWATLSLSC